MAATKKTPPKPKAKTPPVAKHQTKAQKAKEHLGKGGAPIKKKVEKKEVVYPDPAAEIYYKDGSNKPIGYEQAMEWLGWTVVDSKDNPGPHLFVDVNKAKVFLKNNPTNRPFRMGIAKRYMMEILRGKWALNGESITFDLYGQVLSGQHRLVGLVLAEQLRRKNPEKWKPYGWSSPVTIESVVVFGISDAKEVVDTIDLGQKRTLGDVIFRDAMFEGTDKTKKQLANILAGACRLAWLRATGAMVTDAPHFPHSEALDFIEDHPKLIECVHYVYEKEGGSGMEGSRISRYLSLAYAAGLSYLMATSGTDPNDFVEQGPAALDFSMEDKMLEFWDKFASGAELKANSPIFVLRELLPRIEASSAFGRDEKVGMVIKAFNRFVDGKTAQSKDIVMMKGEDDMGKPKLNEEPRLGGIDTEKEETDKPQDILDTPEERKTKKKFGGDIPKHKQKRDDRVGVMEGEQWAAGDTCWVAGNGSPWFGTIKEVYLGDGDIEHSALIMQADDESQEWVENFSDMTLEYPG